MGTYLLDHPLLAPAILLACTVALGLGGVGVAWLLVTLHLLSPDSPVAGAALGLGGALAGAGTGAMIISRIGDRS